MPRTSPQPRWTGRLAHRAIEDRIVRRAAEAVRKADPVTSPKRRAAIVESALKEIRGLAKEARIQVALQNWKESGYGKVKRYSGGPDVSPDDERVKRLAAVVRQAMAIVEQLRPPAEA